MLKKFVFCFAAAVLAANAASYRVTLFQETKVNGKTLKPGDYSVEVKDDSVLFKSGKSVVEAPAKTETAGKKYSTTVVRYNSKSEVTEIQLGGTNKDVVLSTDKPANGM